MQPGYSLRTFMGHSATVMSLDFHPNKDDLICSCDGDGEIRYWSINNGSCARVFKVESYVLGCSHIFFFLLYVCVCVCIFLFPSLELIGVLVVLDNIGRYGTNEIPTPSWEVSCCSCGEHCIYTGCGDTGLSAFITGLTPYSIVLEV